MIVFTLFLFLEKVKNLTGFDFVFITVATIYVGLRKFFGGGIQRFVFKKNCESMTINDPQYPKNFSGHKNYLSILGIHDRPGKVSSASKMVGQHKALVEKFSSF